MRALLAHSWELFRIILFGWLPRLMPRPFPKPSVEPPMNAVTCYCGRLLDARFEVDEGLWLRICEKGGCGRVWVETAEGLRETTF